MKSPLKHTLLVIDDEPDLVQSVKALLRFEYKVLGATRAHEGLQIMEQTPVHIVMSDQRMPEMTGVQLLTQIREKYPDTVRLLFTAYADMQAVIDAINEGNIYRYITKPWATGDLQAMLRQAAEHYDLVMERKQLLTELQDKNAKLEAANFELQQSNELKKAFIKVASHELRTPLTIVLGLADLAKGTKSLPEPVDYWIDRIHHGAQRLTDRVDQMLNLLMADRYDKLLVRKQVSVTEVIQAAIADVRTFVERRHQILEINIAEDVGTFFVEKEKIHDSLLQLMINAVKFTPDQGTIRIKALRKANGLVDISVSDTGMGIEPASLARIFDPFFTRFDVSRHCSGDYEFDRRGLGLGLSVVKAFVEMHGGRIRVHSVVGKGSTFTISIPGNSPVGTSPTEINYSI